MQLKTSSDAAIQKRLLITAEMQKESVVSESPVSGYSWLSLGNFEFYILELLSLPIDLVAPSQIYVPSGRSSKAVISHINAPFQIPWIHDLVRPFPTLPKPTPSDSFASCLLTLTSSLRRQFVSVSRSINSTDCPVNYLVSPMGSASATKLKDIKLIDTTHHMPVGLTSLDIDNPRNLRTKACVDCIDKDSAKM